MVKIAEWARNFFVVLGAGFGVVGTIWAVVGIVSSLANPEIGIFVMYLGTFSFLIAAFIQIAINEYELRKMGL